MKKGIALLLAVLLLTLTGCHLAHIKGECYESGIYVQTDDGQHVLITERGDCLLLVDRTKDDDFSKVSTGDHIEVLEPSCPYTEDEQGRLSINVFGVKRHLFGHAMPEQAMLDAINALYAPAP